MNENINGIMFVFEELGGDRPPPPPPTHLTPIAYNFSVHASDDHACIIWERQYMNEAHYSEQTYNWGPHRSFRSNKCFNCVM